MRSGGDVRSIVDGAAQRRPLITLGIALVVLSPLARPSRWDDLPISSYPMFSRSDIASNHLLAHASSFTPIGRRTPPHRRRSAPRSRWSRTPSSLHAIERAPPPVVPVVAANVGEADAVAIEVVMSRARRAAVFRRRKARARCARGACDVSGVKRWRWLSPRPCSNASA